MIGHNRHMPSKSHGQYCAAVNCSNNRLKCAGKSFFKFPKDEQRCKRWVINTRRQDLLKRKTEYTNRNCVLCMDHFEEQMFSNYQKNRLHPTAVPTLFPNPPRKIASKRLKRAKRKRVERAGTKAQNTSRPTNIIQARKKAKKYISAHNQEHNYAEIKSSEDRHTAPISPKPNDIEVGQDASYVTTVLEISAEREVTETPSQECQEDTVALLLSLATVTPEVFPAINLPSPLPRADDLPTDPPYRTKALKARIAKLERKNKLLRHNVTKLKQQAIAVQHYIRYVFNGDQLKFLSRLITERNFKWSDETLMKAMLLHATCGIAGYEMLLAQGQPLPCSRSLRRYSRKHSLAI